MTPSSHSFYRQQLSIMACDAEILQIAGKRKGCAPERRWRRIYGRFQPDTEPYAIAVFETEGRPQSIFGVEIFACRPPWAEESGEWVEHQELGHIRFTPFTFDPALETLRSVLSAHPGALILRYRPLRRCTIRVQEGDRFHIAKIYPHWFERKNRGQQLVAQGQALCRSVHQADLSFSVARPERWDSEKRTLWQEYVDGNSVWPSLSAQNGRELAFRIGEAAASLTRSQLNPDRILDAAAQLAASTKYAEELARRVPQAASQLRQCLQALQAIHDRAGTGRALRPVHGDMAPGQWLVAGSKLYLLDFDDFAFGDRELDVATFLHELEIGLPSACACEEIGNAFLRGYETIARRLNPNLLAAYLCHKRLYRALTRARTLRPDGDARALQVLQHAYETLACAEIAC